jgi:transcriptional regulator with XRE-family HTH domain
MPATPNVDHDRLLRELGDRVRKHRLELGMSQEALGERAGLHRNYVGGIEQGKRNVAAVNLVKLSLALGLDPGGLLARIPYRRR